MTELKRCSNCKCTQLLETHFIKNRKGEYMKTCNRCRESCKKNRYKHVAYKKQYAINNKEKIAEYKKQHYQENKEKIAERVKEYRDNNKEKIAESVKKYYENNKEKITEINKKYYEDNKEKIIKRAIEYQRQYYKDKRHHCEHETEKYTCKICNPKGHLKMLVTSRVREALQSKKNKSSLEYLGCDIETFRTHLEKSFKEGMTWENQGEWHIDHIIPVLYQQDGIEPSIEEVGRRLHYTNCQAMWADENISKGNRYIGDYQSESDSTSIIS